MLMIEITIIAVDGRILKPADTATMQVGAVQSISAIGRNRRHGDIGEYGITRIIALGTTYMHISRAQKLPHNMQFTRSIFITVFLMRRYLSTGTTTHLYN